MTPKEFIRRASRWLRTWSDEPRAARAAACGTESGVSGALSDSSGGAVLAVAAPWTASNLGADSQDFPAPTLSTADQATVDAFHRIYYGEENGQPVRTYFVSWLGYQMLKCPLDLWIYQEIIIKQRPEVIIETGTFRGGSALYLATLCDLMGHGRVVTVDVDANLAEVCPRHPRITHLTGSSVDPGILAEIEGIVAGRPALVILDSDHRRDHVLAELRAYSRFVPPGGHLIVEDTNINGHPAYESFRPGPFEAVEAYLAETTEFVRDLACERLLMTMCPGGFLRRRER